MNSFHDMGLPQPLLRALDKMGFTEPTPIQSQAIPMALEGRDILGSAQTGTGKTAAFAIPMLVRLMTEKQGSALIMTPTRELAMQVVENVKKLISDFPQLKTALLIGGDSMFKQLQQLKQRPRIVVGTPGRINDHLERGTVRFNDTNFLVLDETDRMLDMGFGVQIDRILQHMPAKRQTLLFSATIPPYIAKLSDKYMNRPERISVGSSHTPVERIRQEIVQTSTAGKYTELLAQLTIREGSVIVFVKTKHGADRLAKKLGVDNHSADAIHGDLNQGKRSRVIQAFRDKKNRILVATDVAARGLDIPHIEHVINYDLPQQPEDYIHRLGRTARAGAEGSAVCFVTGEDRAKWGAIQKLINPGAKGAEYPEEKSGKSGKRKFGGDSRSAARGTRGFAKQKKDENDFYNRTGSAPAPRDSYSRDDRPERKSYDRPAREDREEYRSDDARPAREFGARKPRSVAPAFDRKPTSKRPAYAGSQERTYEDRKPRFDRSERSERPARDFGDRPARSFDDRPKRSFGDRPARAGGSDRPVRAGGSDRPARKYDDRPARTSEREFGDGALRRSAKSDSPDLREGRKFGGKSFSDKKAKSNRRAAEGKPAGKFGGSAPRSKPSDSSAPKGKKFFRKSA